MGNHERSRLNSYFYTPNPSPVGHGIDPEDGLPRPASMVSMNQTKALPLHPDHFVCMEDTREFVGLDGKTRFLPQEVRLADEGWVGMIGKDEVPVEPIRKNCKHYLRQLFHFEEDEDHIMCNRYCGALKDEDGEMFVLSDQVVLACSFRYPPDFISERRLREFDMKIIKAREEAQEAEEEFDVAKELGK